jgi:hypothetical protein
MKKHLLILTISIFSLFANGQNFVNPANQWNVSGSENFGGTHTEIFKIFGDSVIGNKSYNKIFVSYDSTMSNWMYNGLLREDSNKVYYIPQYGNTAGLLYDFSLNAGDTTHIISAWMPEPQEFICQSVDSIIYNSTIYKRWNFSFPYEQWLEGIGSNVGPLYSGASAYVFDLWFSLLCFHRNDTLLYMQPNIAQCYYSTVGLTYDIPKENISLYPNPLTTASILRSTILLTDVELKIYNASGGLVRRVADLSGQEFLIERDNLNSGMYFIQLTKDSTIVGICKMLISDK